MDKTYFNSWTDRESYSIIRDEAYKAGKNIKDLISEIVHNYAQNKKLEKERVNEALLKVKKK